MTEYEKEVYHVEKKFAVTVYDKEAYQVTIDVPYVIEHAVPYPAQIQIPYEEKYEEERTTYEIEEYEFPKIVPYVVETPKVVTEYDTEAITVTGKEVTEHTHDVLHDENFGVDTLGYH